MTAPLIAAFGIVFLAELGDKTQLVALGFGARYRLGVVLAGVGLAYTASTLLSVVIGGVLGEALPTDAISIGGGILFIGFAVWTLRSHDEQRDDDGPVDDANSDEAGVGAQSGVRIVGSIAVAMFVAELGDKTMLATATLAAKGDPVLVWIGATIGITAAGTVGVVVGRLLGDRLPDRVIRWGSALLFAVFGVVLIVTGFTG